MCVWGCSFYHLTPMEAVSADTVKARVGFPTTQLKRCGRARVSPRGPALVRLSLVLLWISCDSDQHHKGLVAPKPQRIRVSSHPSTNLNPLADIGSPITTGLASDVLHRDRSGPGILRLSSYRDQPALLLKQVL